MTKLERKAKYKEHKRRLPQVWTTEMESKKDEHDAISVPSHFKRYTIQDKKIVVHQPIRTSQAPGESYDGPLQKR